MGRVTTSDGSTAGQRAASIVAALGKNAGSEDVFAAFEELDALPPEVVRSVLTPWTGPAPDPDNLDAATRKAHGFPAPPLEVRTVRIVRPKRAVELGGLAQEQVRVAGTTWDGLDLHATARLAADGSESSFAGTLEHRVVTDVSGTPMFEVLLYAGDSGAIFRAGTTELVGAIAYGTVEMKDRLARVALQGSLATTEPQVVTKAASTPAPLAAAAAPAPAPSSVVLTVSEEAEDLEAVSSEAPTKRFGEKAAAPRRKAAAPKVAPVGAAEATEVVEAKKPAAKKAAAVKKPAAKKAAAVKKPAAKKAAAAKKPAAKKAAAAKKPAAKKAAAAKKPAAKKAAATKKAPAVKKKTAAKTRAR